MYEINGIVYAGGFKESIKISEAKVTGHLMMLLTFSTGEKRVFDASILSGEVFKPLSDDNVFEDFKIVHGVLTWCDEEIDCAPEYMYKNSFSYEEAVS